MKTACTIHRKHDIYNPKRKCFAKICLNLNPIILRKTKNAVLIAVLITCRFEDINKKSKTKIITRMFKVFRNEEVFTLGSQILTKK